MCVCMCLVCRNLGSFWITEGAQRRAEPGPAGPSDAGGGGPKTCGPLLSAPPTDEKEIRMLPGALLPNRDGNQPARSAEPDCKKKKKKPEQPEKTSTRHETCG